MVTLRIMVHKAALGQLFGQALLIFALASPASIAQDNYSYAPHTGTLPSFEETMQRYQEMIEEPRRRYSSRGSSGNYPDLKEFQQRLDAQRQRTAKLMEQIAERSQRDFGYEPRRPEYSRIYDALIERFNSRRPNAVTRNSLATLYESYDRNGDGTITWHDIERFQSDLMANSTYRPQRRALSAVEFHASGGGNCVDYALATADFLAHFGVRSYIAAFFSPGARTGHAIVLVPVDKVPAGYRSYTLAEPVFHEGVQFPPGTYVPIDYEYVGAISSATPEDGRLHFMWRPQDMPGNSY